MLPKHVIILVDKLYPDVHITNEPIYRDMVRHFRLSEEPKQKP